MDAENNNEITYTLQIQIGHLQPMIRLRNNNYLAHFINQYHYTLYLHYNMTYLRVNPQTQDFENYLKLKFYNFKFR